MNREGEKKTLFVDDCNLGPKKKKKKRTMSVDVDSLGCQKKKKKKKTISSNPHKEFRQEEKLKIK